MHIRDVLLGLTTYPNPTAIDAVKGSASFAEFMNCRITAFVSDAKIEAPGSLLDNSLINFSAMAGEEMKKSEENAQSLLASFDDLAEKPGVPHEAIHEHELVGEIPNLLAEYARLRDLTIIPVPAEDYVDQWYAETVVFQSGPSRSYYSGRPSLLDSNSTQSLSPGISVELPLALSLMQFHFLSALK